jgi:hypothetical protein
MEANNLKVSSRDKIVGWIRLVPTQLTFIRPEPLPMVHYYLGMSAGFQYRRKESRLKVSPDTTEMSHIREEEEEITSFQPHQAD